MSRQIDHPGQDNLGGDRSGFWVRSVYYAIIIGLGLMLFMVVFLAR